MECVINLVEFVLCCGKIEEDQEEEKVGTFRARGSKYNSLTVTSVENLNRPLFPQRVESLKPKVSDLCSMTNSVYDQSGHKPTQKFPDIVGSLKPIKISHDGGMVSSPLPLISSVHKSTEKFLALENVLCLNKPETEIGSSMPTKKSQDNHNTSNLLPLISSAHDQLVHNLHGNILASNGASSLKKYELPATDVYIKPIKDKNKVNSPLPLINLVDNHSAHKSPQEFWASDATSSLNKSQFRDGVISLKPVEISQNKLIVSSPLPLVISLHDQSVQKSAASDGTSCLNKPGSPKTFVDIKPIRISQDGHNASTSSNTSSSSDSLLKPVEFLKLVSLDGCKISNSVPLVSSFHDQSAKKWPMKQSLVSPLSKTKQIWVERMRKSLEITESSGIKESARILQDEKQIISHVFESIMQPMVKDLSEQVQYTQKGIKSFVKVSLNSSPSKKIWVKKSPRSLERMEIGKPLSVSRDKQPDSEEKINELQGMQIDSNIDDESMELLPTAKKYKLLVYPIPENLKDLIENDMVPEVLWEPLTLETYTDYFAALLYAEDFYHEKWADYLLKGVTLELHEEKSKKGRDDNNMSHRSHMDKDNKVYVKFEIDSVPERRPYLLSRDFVFLRHAGKDSTPFEGRFYRVMKSTHVLAEFGDDFYSQYSPNDKYDVSFSFNRVCLKRSHQAVASAMDPSFRHILFPDKFSHVSPCSSFQNDIRDMSSDSIVQKIATMQGHSPYLITSSFSTYSSIIRDIVRKSVLKIYKSSPSPRILICAVKNKTCDALAASLNEVISDSELFRANAAFREYLDVDDGVIPLCSYDNDGECFTTPSLCELKNYRIVTSTFVSSFRLCSCGINAGHFTHIFLVEASIAIEPESMIPLANLAGEKTAVVIIGCTRESPRWVRSDIARLNGLKRSYFQRLLESEPYCRNDPLFVAHLDYD